MGQRIGGTIYVSLDGKRVLAKGEFEWRRGVPKRTTVVGVDGVHGFTEAHQPAMVKGTVTVLDYEEHNAIVNAERATITLDLVNGHTVFLRDAHFVSEGTVRTNEGEMEVEFNGTSLEVT
jgi:hypothetical protein